MKIYRTRLWISFIGIMSVLFFSSVAIATTIATNGDIVLGNSWYQFFQSSSTGIAKIEAFIINDTGSENVDFGLGAEWGLTDGDGLAYFSEGGWNGSMINPNYALATGPSNITNPFVWVSLFTGTAANQNFDLDYLVYGQDAGQYYLGATARFHWDNGWTYAEYEPIEYDRAPVPEPATMFLLGTGLVGVAGAARKKKKNLA